MMRIRNLRSAPVAALSVLTGLLVFASVPAQATDMHSVIGSFGAAGIGSGSFADPESIAVEQSTGVVYVYAIGEDESGEAGDVYKFNAAGEPENFSSTATNVIEGVGGEAKASEIAVDNSSGPDKGDIYIATGESVSIYSSSGTKLETLIEEEEPCGVAVDSSGAVYVAFYGSESIRRYVPTTDPVSTSDYTSSLSEVGKACDIAADSAGDIYAALYSGAGVMKYEAAQFGTEETKAIGTAIDSKGTTLAVDAVNGDVYINEKSEIAEYTSTGTLVESFGSLAGSFGVGVNDGSEEVYAPEEEEGGEVIIFGSPSAAEYPLTYTTAGSGSGTVACEIQGSGILEEPCTSGSKYPEGAEVKLIEKPGPGSTFIGWGVTGQPGVCPGAVSECVVTMSAAESVTATFNAALGAKLQLTIHEAGTGTGKVECEVNNSGRFEACTAEYDEGTKITLKGTAEPGTVFEGWSGGAGSASSCVGTGPCTFTINALSEVTATFDFASGGKEGKEGKPGINGENGGRGPQGPARFAGAQGERGPVGANGVNGKDGAEGPAGPVGARGPAGKVELVTCRTVKLRGKHMQRCTTKLVSGTVRLTASGATAHVLLSRGGAVYATGTAHIARRRMRLRLMPLRGLRPGHYTLTLISGVGRHEVIRTESFALRRGSVV
jgi:hypothetical protein